MGKQLNKDVANKILIENGYFQGLQMLVRDYELSDEKAAKYRAALFKHILRKINEVKNEIARLQATVARMESACRAGSIPNQKMARMVFDTNVNNLFEALVPFDGWAISLLESHISLLATIRNPETAGIRVKGLQNSFATLWNLRMSNHGPFDNYPEVFDMGGFWDPNK